MKRSSIAVMIGGTLGLVLAQAAPFFKKDVVMKDLYPCVSSVQQACLVYPKTVNEITTRCATAQKNLLESINQLVDLPETEYNKETVLRFFDQLRAWPAKELAVFGLVKSVYPEQAMIQAAQDAYVALSQFMIEHLESNKALYAVFKKYQEGAAQTEELSEEDRYFLNKIVESFELQGLNLPEEKQKQILALKKECAQLESDFSTAIDQDATVIKVTENQLAGVSEDFKTGLTRDGDLFVLPMNYPTQSMVMNYCGVEETRKQYSKVFKNKAYPANEAVLETLRQKRNQIAKLLGFESYAAYDVKTQMIKTPERAWEFENNLQKKALVLAEKNFKQLTSDLPEGVTLTKDGKMYPWDMGYVSTYFKKKYYDIDEQKFAEYFPMEKTVAGLIAIYEKFFDLIITTLPVSGMWHPDVSVLEVKSKADKKVLGYIFLDMYPREKKYGHAAAFDAVCAIKKDDGSRTESVLTVVCNFTKATKEKPSLLRYSEVTTFFHEFGHAIHATLAATKYYALSGFNTETDFVELPSQMLENWMEDKEILGMISSHYLTGEPLPEELIEKRLELLKFGQGLFITSQLGLGMISLELFGPSCDEPLAQVFQRITQENDKHLVYDTETHRYCSFGHLTGYAAKYYGYLWSLVLAYDVFEQIEKEGLLNPDAGKKYVDAILSKGGSQDANDMLRNYLGREPRFDAFYKKMGLE